MIPRMDPAGVATHGKDYADRLIRLQTAPWKRWLDVQAPHRWNLRRLHPGFTLDIGWRRATQPPDLPGHSVGIDVNEHRVRAARARGPTVFTPDQSAVRRIQQARPLRFHPAGACRRTYDRGSGRCAPAPVRDALIRPDGKLILISPQRGGIQERSDRGS